MGVFVKLENPLSPLREGKEFSLHSSGNVIVLAKNFRPTHAQWTLLNRGLTFIPALDANKDQKTQLQLDMQKYHRKLKLVAYFRKNNKREPRPFMPTSTWNPPPDKIPTPVHNLVEQDKKDFKQLYRRFPERTNLSRTEVKALRDLMHEKRIVIKPADKGSAVVIMGREQYVREASRQLNDETYYKKLEGPIYPQTIPIVHNIINSLYWSKFINKKQSQYLKGAEQPRERRFYILPKVHKEPEKWNPPFEMPPGRPIVSDCNSDTYRTAEYIEYFLHPLSIKHPSYVKDTYHFIEMVRNLKIPTNSFFFTIDIVSLYTNIDTEAGMAAVKTIFQRFPDAKRPDRELLKLLEINLTRNDFVFDSKYYLQVKGTAMGKMFSPSYANMFMAIWEEGALAKCPKKPLHYLRYLDDIWGVWVDSREEFDQFISILNNHDASIKLQYTVDPKSIDYLDTTIYKGLAFDLEQKLDIKVHFKQTDAHALLFKTSFHPKHTFKGLVKSQLLRFYRICTQAQDFKEAVKILFRSLRERGYSRSFLRRSLKTFLVQKDKDSKEIIPLITTFSTPSLNLNRIIKTNFEEFIAQSSLLQNYRVISAYRKNKNLADILVRAKLKPLWRLQIKQGPDYFCNLNYVRNQTDGTLFRISQRFGPKSRNCVYLLFCKTCGKQYIGETKNPISVRMWQHKYKILQGTDKDSPVVQHFKRHGWPAVQVAGIERSDYWTEYERKKCEKKWIYLLKTVEPFGLNRKLAMGK